MSIFKSLIKKEVLHLVRDFRTLTVVLVIPDQRLFGERKSSFLFFGIFSVRFF